MGSAVFKTVEESVPLLAGSIPVRLRHLRKRRHGRRSYERASPANDPGFYHFSTAAAPVRREVTAEQHRAADELPRR